MAMAINCFHQANLGASGASTPEFLAETGRMEQEETERAVRVGPRRSARAGRHNTFKILLGDHGSQCPSRTARRSRFDFPSRIHVVEQGAPVAGRQRSAARRALAPSKLREPSGAQGRTRDEVVAGPATTAGGPPALPIATAWIRPRSLPRNSVNSTWKLFATEPKTNNQELN